MQVFWKLASNSQFRKEMLSKAGSVFSRSKKGGEKSSAKKARKDGDEAPEQNKNSPQNNWEQNARTDGKEWTEVIDDEKASAKAANANPEQARGRSLSGPISKAPTSAVKEGELTETAGEIGEREQARQNREQEGMEAEKEKSWEEKNTDKANQIEDQVEEGEKMSGRSWREKEDIRRNTNNTEFKSEESLSDPKVESENLSTGTQSLELLRSDSSTYFLPTPEQESPGLVVDDGSRRDGIELLREGEENTPQYIVDEWMEKNGGEYEQNKEAIEYEPPPMDLDGGESAADGGSDGGGDGGGD